MVARVKAMRTAFLLAVLTTTSVADYPDFCDRSCTVSVGAAGAGEKRVYLHVPYHHAVMSETVTVLVGSGNVSVRAFVPLPYNYSGDFEVASSGSFDVQSVSPAPHLNVYYQTAEYPLLTSGNHESIGSVGTGAVIRVTALKPNAFPKGLNILFKVNHPGEVSALELLGMPILQWNAHAYWWTQQMYFYIFTAVNSAMAVLYGVFTRCRVWQWMLVFSIAAFATVADENLYHGILASRRGGGEQEQIYMLSCVCLLANIVPAAVAMLFMRYGKCRAVGWSVVAVLFGAGFLFLAGAGWFVGCGLLILGGLTRLAQRNNVCNLVLQH